MESLPKRARMLLAALLGVCAAEHALAFAAGGALAQPGRVPARAALCALRGSASAKSAGEAAGAPPLTTPVCMYKEYVVKTSKKGPPAQDITVEDLTPSIEALVKSSGVREGTVTVISRHTTTAITINEWESVCTFSKVRTK